MEKQRTLFSESEGNPDMEHPCEHCGGMTPESELQYVNDEFICEECKRLVEKEAAGEEWKGEQVLDDDDELD